MRALVQIIARRAGEILLGIGLIHICSGFLFYTDSLYGILGAGVINTVDQNPAWFGLFWYEISGFFLVLFGSLADQFIRQQKILLPALHGYLLLPVSLLGIVLEPYSGFYLFVPVAIFIIVKGRKSIFPKTSP